MGEDVGVVVEKLCCAAYTRSPQLRVDCTVTDVSKLMNQTGGHDDFERSSEAKSRTRQLSSSELLGDDRIVEINHKGDIYRLQVTRQDKLILTK